MSRDVDALDRALAAKGQDIVLRRVVGVTNQVNVDVRCRAFVRNYAPHELTSLIIQGDSEVTISLTEIGRAQWPGGQPVASPPVATDPRVPIANVCKAIIGGKLRNVQAAAPIYVNGELVRIRLQVRG